MTKIPRGGRGRAFTAAPACAVARRRSAPISAALATILHAAERHTGRLFNPRAAEARDRHFRVDAATDGLTEVGRDTVECLKTNHARPLAARAAVEYRRLLPLTSAGEQAARGVLTLF